jgi:hypothetical protein
LNDNTIFLDGAIVLHRIYDNLAFYLYGDVRDCKAGFLCSSSLETVSLVYLLSFLGEGVGREFMSARSVTPACRDKGGGQLVNRVGINTYFGSVNLLDIRRCEYVEWRAFGVNFPSI